MVERMVQASPTRASVLLADIGGTHARFALGDPSAARPLLDHSIVVFPVDRFPSLADAARHYLRERPATARVRGVVAAVAGPVREGEARMTNHPWVVSERRIGEALEVGDVALVNDFVAQAMAVRQLGDADVAPVGGPFPVPAPGRDATAVVLGAGTGLGVGVLVRREGRWTALATEAGHVGFAPGTAEEVAVLERLSRDYGRVSNERLASGAGLVNLHRALADIDGEASRSPQPALRPEDVTAGAAAGDARCVRALALFCAVFGAIAGDLVLAYGAWDGAWLGGGLAPLLLPALQRSAFRERFEDKGRHAAAMRAVPTFAVLHPQPGLLGAAVIAADRAAADAR